MLCLKSITHRNGLFAVFIALLIPALLLSVPNPVLAQAQPAIPATPAQPGGPGNPATPATPATPAIPANPEKISKEQIKEAVKDAKEAAKAEGVTKDDVKAAAEKLDKDKQEELKKGKGKGEDVGVPEINPASMGFALVLLVGGLLCLTDPRKRHSA